MLTANAMVITSETPKPRYSPPPGPPSMIPTPHSATSIAPHARRLIGSPSVIRASRAAAMGDAAWRKSTFATLVWLSATMKEPDAMPVEAAKARPAHPIVRNARHASPRMETNTKAARATVAKTARPASCVAVDRVSSRCNTPAVDHATVARAM